MLTAKFAAIAQLVEHVIGNDEVISSILITSSNKKAPENAENQLFSGVFHHF